MIQRTTKLIGPQLCCGSSQWLLCVKRVIRHTVSGLVAIRLMHKADPSFWTYTRRRKLARRIYRGTVGSGSPGSVFMLPRTIKLIGPQFARILHPIMCGSRHACFTRHCHPPRPTHPQRSDDWIEHRAFLVVRRHHMILMSLPRHSPSFPSNTMSGRTTHRSCNLYVALVTSCCHFASR